MPSATRVQRARIGNSQWEVAQRELGPALRPHVLRMIGYDERSPVPQRQRQLPVPFVVLIIELGAPLRVALGDEARVLQHRGGFVAGLGDAHAVTEHGGHQRGIQIDLGPTGARRVLGLPLHELGPQVVGLHDLLSASHRRWLERIEAAPTWDERLRLAEELLLLRIHASPVSTRRVDWAIARIEASGGTLRVAQLARELECSHKHLISLFRDRVGVTPKLLARLVRFDRVVQQIRRAPSTSWAELAAAHGFSDQAHLAREVRRLTGLSARMAREPMAELVELFR